MISLLNYPSFLTITAMDYVEDSHAAVEMKHKGAAKDGGSLNIRRIENTIYFSERITYETAHHLCLMLRGLELDILDDIDKVSGAAKKEKSKYVEVCVEPRPIRLVLTTHGGLVHAAFSVVDTIRSLKVPVHTVVSGYVASAGTLISLAGAKRFITPNSFMMIHEVRSGFWGRYSDARIEHMNITKLMEHIISYYTEKTKIPKERLTDMLKTDTDLAPAESLELGLVDVVEKY